MPGLTVAQVKRSLLEQEPTRSQYLTLPALQEPGQSLQAQLVEQEQHKR